MVWPLTWAQGQKVPGAGTTPPAGHTQGTEVGGRLAPSRRAQAPLALADTYICIADRAPPTHLRASGARPAPGLSGRCLAAQTPGRGDPCGQGAGRGGAVAHVPRRPHGRPAPARGVCAGPMFTELSTQLSPPRGRAGAVRAGFGERRDVDGERGWTGDLAGWGLGDRGGGGGRRSRGGGAHPC